MKYSAKRKQVLLRRHQRQPSHWAAHHAMARSMTPMTLFIEIVGWTGAALILGSYILLSLGRLQGQSRAYQWMNVAGAAGFIINSGYNGAIPSAALNVAWLGIGLYTLWMISRRGAEAGGR